VAKWGNKDDPMTPSKRMFDLVCALLLVVVLVPVMLCIAALILLADGRPILHRSERMSAPGRGFVMLKFRTMRHAEHDSGVTGGNKAGRITRSGRFLRPWRLDELPQLWNVLRGDMSFVGPRPPMRDYVERYPALYARVLRARPGITGLGTLVVLRMEARLLRAARSAAETDAIYCRACLPRKAALDLRYQARRSLRYDMMLMVRTVLKLHPELRFRLFRLRRGLRHLAMQAVVPRAAGPVAQRVSRPTT
jgi:lipopolysaccharide/colanic/teichoic acid biosynthesis glycosyltransferase